MVSQTSLASSAEGLRLWVAPSHSVPDLLCSLIHSKQLYWPAGLLHMYTHSLKPLEFEPLQEVRNHFHSKKLDRSFLPVLCCCWDLFSSVNLCIWADACAATEQGSFFLLLYIPHWHPITHMSSFQSESHKWEILRNSLLACNFRNAGIWVC